MFPGGGRHFYDKIMSKLPQAGEKRRELQEIDAAISPSTLPSNTSGAIQKKPAEGGQIGQLEWEQRSAWRAGLEAATMGADAKRGGRASDVRCDWAMVAAYLSHVKVPFSPLPELAGSGGRHASKRRTLTQFPGRLKNLDRLCAFPSGTAETSPGLIVGDTPRITSLVGTRTLKDVGLKIRGTYKICSSGCHIDLPLQPQNPCFVKAAWPHTCIPRPDRDQLERRAG